MKITKTTRGWIGTGKQSYILILVNDYFYLSKNKNVTHHGKIVSSCLMMYGVRNEQLSSDSECSDEEAEAEGGAGVAAGAVSEEGVRADPDLLLVPAVVSGVVLPKLTGNTPPCSVGQYSLISRNTIQNIKWDS